MSSWSVAAWIVQRADESGAGSLWLGPRLSLLHLPVPAGELQALEPEDIAQLVAEGFLVPAGQEAALGPPEPVQEGPLEGGVYLLGPEAHAAEAGALARALRAEGIPCARVRGPEALPARRPGVPAPVVLFIHALEPGAPASVVEPLLPHARVLWFGECAEGLHAGPLLERREDVERYVEASWDWSFFATFRELGFGAEWPLSLLPRLREEPAAVARAVAAVLRAPPGTCHLVEEARPVSLWPWLREAPAEPEGFAERQRWSKGLLSHLTLRPLAGLEGAFTGSCLTPCGGESFLESNFGKGTQLEQARRTTVGEAVERFASWRANHPPPPPPEPPSRHYRLEDFHPSGPSWLEYLARGASEELPARAVRDELTGALVSVPECLIPFPFTPPTPQVDPDANTAGLAAFPTREGAVLRGALELLERHNFYPAFLHLAPGELVPLERLGQDPEAATLRRLADALAARHMRLWLICYPEDFGLPIVQAFLHDRAAGHLSRGSGSGRTLAAAALRALLEALMTWEQHEFSRQAGEDEDPHRARDSYAAWRSPELIAQVVAYLDRQPALARSVPSYADDAALLAQVKGELRRRGIPLLVADLPCPVQGWSAVRVLLPGVTSTQQPSESAGGRRLMSPAFRYGVPT